MSRPDVMSSTTEELYGSLHQLAEGDEGRGWPLLRYCDAVGRLLHRMEFTRDAPIAPYRDALVFGGSYDQVSCGNDTELQLSTCTLEAWVYVPTVGGAGSRGILGKPGAWGIHVFRGELGFQDFSANVFRTSGVALPVGWHHVALVVQSGVPNGSVLYLDTVQVLAATCTVLNQVTEVKVGAVTFPEEPWVCRIAEARLWNTVRLQRAILLDHRTQLTGREPGLLAYWRLDEGRGSVAYDQALGRRDGVIDGVPARVPDGGPLLEVGADGVPGWGTAFDLKHIPSVLLPWAAQFVGVREQVGADHEALRRNLEDRPGFTRGTVAAMTAAAKAHLTGDKRVYVTERDTSAYHFRVRTLTTETPDHAKVQSALQGQKPAGLQFTYDVVAGQSWSDVTAANASWGVLSARNITWDQLRLVIP